MQTLDKILLIGQKINDNESEILRKQFLIYQGLGMSLGGVVWGSLLVFFSFPYHSITPYGYVVLTIINLFIFNKTKNFTFARNYQTVISMFLPFILQWTLGGFVISGGVMLWSILAMVLSISYQNIKTNIVWLSVYIGLTFISFWFDDYFVVHFNMGVSSNVSKIFQISNVVAVSIMILLLFVYFVTVNSQNLERVKETFSKLVNSEKLAILGQISAGVAHEVNTPLGAIKSSAEESALAYNDVINAFVWITKELNEEDKNLFLKFIQSSSAIVETISTKEERLIKNKLNDRFKELCIDNSQFLSDRLVQVGIYEIGPELMILSQNKDFYKIVMMLYHILNQQKSNHTIQIAVDKASRIVKALKTYIHTSSIDEMEFLNIPDNIETVLTIYHNKLKQGIEVVKNYEKVPEFYGFADQLNQVWTNLIVNAVQAMENVGTLTIGINLDDKHIVVSIQDTGKGIEQSINNKIFEPFFTTKSTGEGSGLGLDIVSKILHSHSANIYFESIVGVGTTFYVKLPI